MTLNLRNLTINENNISVTASNKDLDEKEFLFSHSIVPKHIFEDSKYEVEMFFQRVINNIK